MRIRLLVPITAPKIGAWPKGAELEIGTDIPGSLATSLVERGRAEAVKAKRAAKPAKDDGVGDE